MEKENIYFLVVRVNEQEFLATSEFDGKKMFVMFQSLEQVRHGLSDFYRVLSAGPVNDPIAFAEACKRLARFLPAVVKLPADELGTILTNAKTNDDMLKAQDPTLFDRPMWYIRVKDGFIEKYLALDIIEDIQSSFAVDRDGKFIFNQVNFHNMDKEPK